MSELTRFDGKPVKDWSVLVGHRCLMVVDAPFEDGYEVRVLEMSPSKGLIKFRFEGGMEVWEHPEDWLPVEDLGEKG